MTSQGEELQLQYDDHLEKLLKDQAEIAESLSILHRNAHRKFGRWTNLINIPVIIGSSVVGFTTGLDLSYINNINIILGIISVFIGIIKSLDSYFQLGRISETHRMVSLAYSQINKKIAVELALNRKDRISPKDMLSIVKTDVKNLEDISPLIPEDIIKEYKLEFEKFQGIKKPNITNGLSPVEINTTDLRISAEFVNNNVPLPFKNNNPIEQIITINPITGNNFTSNNQSPHASVNDYKTNATINDYKTNASNKSVPYADVNSPDLGEPM